MRHQKISRGELLERCAEVFKRSGYHGTTMDSLASACGLTKASFYHHYSNKEALAADAMSWAQSRIEESLFKLAYDDASPAADRFQEMTNKTRRLFEDGAVGCLMAVISIDAAYSMPQLMAHVRSFMDSWAQALTHLFSGHLPATTARQLGMQTVADYEGAILISRIYNDFSCFDRVGKRVLSVLTGTNEPDSCRYQVG
ncbi:TPA: TetR/AcrR family transcriptional regulator [Pseudomonas aeruginosa]|uniref:TetR/AcrR family transcriptional regulator n=2 Tax=Pseudomonas aeruginosa TaxID=287 RepID=UPI00104FAA67|nr:TetR/AcrR family transcriptional regulator [Pseudomonas aeruginosa]MCO3566930.1 TetR/AcrR family transcriptional regulator [Pseudomonas aeruginosa]MCP9250902.1 TetR/AcrR family transcriptional regulator [Pseudomonas aeruginosa]MDN3850421.1 TetR/AcrR family transcriptional regulator [Pseudomonas aeruginosa]WCV63310.1 TetR/AcrR family transcriptional regulator [Pseudomonas aeruginosa]HBO4053254.1 TetR/AcrR family transcriptional regulator [Pseudomonas aeruginosa]